MSGPNLPPNDVDILRRLGERIAAAAQDPVNLERKHAWYALDAGADGRPMILAEAFAVRDEHPPCPDSMLACRDPWARGVERGLRFQLYQFEDLQDDHVIEPFVQTAWRVQVGDYGVQPVRHTSPNAGRLGAMRWDAPLADLDRDFEKLHPRTYSVDRAATRAEKERLERVFDGILGVRIRGEFWWTLGLTWAAVELIGLENLMLFMFDQPRGLHRLMQFLHDDHLAYARWLETEGLLAADNENDYIGSGSMGYTRDLPRPDLPPGRPVRMLDKWALLESQETVGVGPDQFEEFIFPYQHSLAGHFGKVYYGCCEPVHSRWHVLRRLPNLARVSVSPWADEPFMADALGRAFVYSRKPNPTLISTERFDEQAIRADLRRTLDVARGCRLELIMKDVHTLNNEPERLARWVALAREEASRG